MFYKLDWLSWTVPCRGVGQGDDPVTYDAMWSALREHCSSFFNMIDMHGQWAMAAPRGFYKNRLTHEPSGLSVSWSTDNPYCLVECSGRTMDWLMTMFTVSELAEATNGRATRIDLAVDMECSTVPQSFVRERDAKRFKTSGIFTSESGETCYVGSRSGERMARVYRYAPPHPRSHLLRAEAEYKGGAAKEVCKQLVLSSLKSVTLAAHLPFGWQHPDWKPDEAEISKIPARPYDKSNDGRWRWLMEVAWPALKKGHEEGYINLTQLIEGWINDGA